MATEVVVQAPAMKRLYRLLERVAQIPINVVLIGESGVGKDVAAEAIHRASPRKTKGFVHIDVARLPRREVAGALFGVDDGGAELGHPGRFEAADGGTVFLDGVDALPLDVQQELLHVINERKVLRVGALQPRAIDIRLIAATRSDLMAQVEAGRFRGDLLERLNGITIRVPPLRERSEEIPLLARLFVQRLCEIEGRPTLPQVTPGAMTYLSNYEWPGNVRELRSVMERSVFMADDEITPVHLPLEIMGSLPGAESDATEA